MMIKQKSNVPSLRNAPSLRAGGRAHSRSNCFGMLALVFRGPLSCQVVQQLRSGPMAEALSDFGYDVSEDLAGELQAVTERLAEEYTCTFVGPGPHVSPYASVYHNGEGQLWGDSTVRVKRFIEVVGLSFEGNWDSIPDHIAIELELMQRLCAYEAQLWAGSESTATASRENGAEQLHRCLELEQKFLQDYLCVWVPRFCARLLETSTSRFYREMAKLTAMMVEDQPNSRSMNHV